MRSSMFISRAASKCILHQAEALRKHYTKVSDSASCLPHLDTVSLDRLVLIHPRSRGLS